MLHILEDLYEASISATDGTIGRVHNFLFDEGSWTIRYVVVKVGGWLARHDVVIAVTALDQPNWTSKAIHARLTRDQVRHSPDVDSRKPVARQEIAMREHYGWPAAWQTGAFLPVPVPAGREFPAKADDDPHLRGTEQLTGYQVWAEDGEVGRLNNFILNEDAWEIGYLIVGAGDWLHHRSLLIPTQWVKSVSWAKRRINLTTLERKTKATAG